ncbi:hypothetical protein GOQ27_11410 [Clostridium sp. D2Q-11]|uniref:Uncharacterized protein n=1 Tax=Anaeromonas frigoriresistens TaxID=2683708 RepID=A0A942UTX2_9FIRM|nr:hypothetical protein [Anaeromonas frigoriresistens]MBS4539073.1 hypothetical protein [Anaeromonas frigoriresistens]
MKDKKILIVFSLITLALILSLTLIDQDKGDISKGTDKQTKDISEEDRAHEDEKTGKGSKGEKDYSSDSMDNIYLEKEGDSIYLKSSSNNINSITSLEWFDKETIAFNFTYQEKGESKNSIYEYKTSQNKVDIKFNIEGMIWEWKRVNKNAIIYSNDGFNGLYYMNNNGDVEKISERQEWYHISPDGNKVIVNGIPAKSDKSENERFIYNIDKKHLQKANYIPDIDYVFSYIAATWSPDSTHIVSQIPNVNNQINIIDINKGIEKEIKMDDTILTSPIWSNDGEKLAFLIQSKDYEEYIFDSIETNYYLSDKIGIYDTKTKKIKVINFKKNLTTSEIYWSEDNKGIIIQTAKIKDIQKNLISPTENIKGEVQYINIETEDNMIVLEDIVDLSEGYPSHKITPIELFENNMFMFRDGDKDIKSISIIDLDTEKTINEDIGYLYDYSRQEENIFLISDEGIFTIDTDFKVNNIMNFKSYYGEDILNVEVRISPNHEKILLYAQYNEGSSNKPFIEVRNITPFNRPAN